MMRNSLMVTLEESCDLSATALPQTVFNGTVKEKNIVQSPQCIIFAVVGRPFMTNYCPEVVIATGDSCANPDAAALEVTGA